MTRYIIACGPKSPSSVYIARMSLPYACILRITKSYYILNAWSVEGLEGCLAILARMIGIRGAIHVNITAQSPCTVLSEQMETKMKRLGDESGIGCWQGLGLWSLRVHALYRPSD